jgi:hypothetical protein
VGGATGEAGVAAALEAEIKRRGLVPGLSNGSGTGQWIRMSNAPLDGAAPPRAGASGFRGVARREKNGEWFAQIVVVGKVKHLGYFEATARGKVDAALAYDAAARAAGRPERTNFLVKFTGVTKNSQVDPAV